MIRRIPPVSRSLIKRFFVAVDSEGVALFQWLFYVLFIMVGVYGLVIANSQPPLSVKYAGPMAAMNITLWYWLHIAGPGTCLIGKLLTRTKSAYAGMWLQLGGDLGLALALAAYNTATYHSESWGRGMYGAFPLGTATFLSVVILTVRDVRRMRVVERLK
ncbi:MULTISPECIES: hypothetical protein [unclassified Mycobacterium]|uniref:hypothetical protein n=1 Tax=unclassified Mycobacterium TaxID=2642494 RepID=UPI0007FFA5A2|nr:MULTISPECIES: hypothetical protein [unclassified Mycobacterium]OBG71320.1 hypothetical protein A5700_12150 [Mycobacterium sp. E1214]OBH28688.1 hypothetical protein A5693_21465 [Mycobacterium sp. E1319]